MQILFRMISDMEPFVPARSISGYRPSSHFRDLPLLKKVVMALKKVHIEMKNGAIVYCVIMPRNSRFWIDGAIGFLSTEVERVDDYLDSVQDDFGLFTEEDFGEPSLDLTPEGLEKKIKQLILSKHVSAQKVAALEFA